MTTQTKGELALRHLVLVGGAPPEWAAMGEAAWEHRLAELGKGTDHVGASWLALRPYGPASGDPVEPWATSEVVGGCTVVADNTADGRDRLVTAVERLRLAGRPIDETSIAAALNAPALVDPDLVVILGRSDRLPPSLVWELAYSELVFETAALAELGPEHLRRAVTDFQGRQRRFGGLDG